MSTQDREDDHHPDSDGEDRGDSNDVGGRPDPGDGEDSGEAGDASVAVENLTKVYSTRDGEDLTAVDDVSFTIESGTIVGLLGPNGAGKTTTIKSMLGLVVPTAGRVRIAGQDVHDDLRSIYRHVSAMLEGNRNAYWRMTVRENLEFFTSLQGVHPKSVRDHHDELLEQLRLTDKADEVVRNLSRGMKQKVSLAVALARDTPVVFMDEPTLGLDVEAARELQRDLRYLVEEHDRTVVMSSHDMDVVQNVCDRVVILNEGRIAVDRPVAELGELFETSTYRVELDGHLSDDRRALVEEQYEITGWDVTDSRTAFTVVFESRDRLYDVVDLVQDSDADVESLSASEADLEEIFLSLTREDDDLLGGYA